MMTTEQTELAALRAEVAQIRRQLDRALDRLDLPTSRYPDRVVPDYPHMEFESVAVRNGGQMHIPVIIRSDDIESGVMLFDASQKMRGWFGIDAEGHVRLEILNAAGEVAVTVGEGPGGGGEIIVNDADGTPRAGLKAGEFGGVVSAVDARGNALATLMGTAQGGQVFICTPQQKAAVTLKSAPEGGMITLAEPSGQVMGHFSVTAAGSALSVYGEQGAPAVTVSGLGEPGGTLVFFTPDGERTKVLPMDL